MVRCNRHGVFYNPDRFDGCAVCRSGAQKSQEDRKLSPVALLAGVVGIAVVGLMVGKGLMSAAAHGDSVMEEASRTANRIDPNTYRSEVEALEELVYAERVPSFDYGGSILRAASTLSDMIRSKESGLLLRSRNQQASMEILSFGQGQAASEEVGYALMDLSVTRTEWEEVRGRVFLDADWFRHTTPRVGSVAKPSSPTMHPSTLRMLQDLATELDQTVRLARSHTQRIGDLTVDPRSSEGQRLRADWDSFRQSMQTRLSGILTALPEGGRWMTNDAATAHQYLTQAVDQLTGLVRSSTPPPTSQRTATLNAAQRLIDQAKRYLEPNQP